MPTRKDKRNYIGGTTSEARKKYFNYDKELTQIVTNLATSYGISPALVIDRLAHEGLVDRAIINNNLISTGSIVDVFGPSLFSNNNNSTYNSPYGLLGLDNIYDTYSKGITKTKRPINIRKMTTRNESGETVNSGETKNLYDTLELFTAELASRRNQVKRQYPNLTDTELDSATAARYNATNRYFKQLMDSGDYKSKYPIDVKGVNIPTPTKTDSKYIQDQTHTVNMDRAFRTAPKETFIYNDKSWNPKLFMTDGYIDEPESPIVKHFLNNYAVQNFTQPNKVNFIQEKYKCGGRRKAQLGLDIREGGIAIPIANNMWYIHGRKHEYGGVTMGPNNKNGVEVEGGEVVEMIDSNHPSVGRQFAAGGQSQTMRVFSSVPLLRGVSPAQLVMGGANPDAVFKAQEDFKDRNRINDDGTRYEMGGEGKPKPKRSRPVTGVLPYGYTIRNLYAVENPYRKGIKGNVTKMYDSRTLGAGVDVVSGHPELYKKAKSGKMTKKQADETAVIHLRKDDNAIRSNYADVYGKAAADTLSYGPRFLVAQARYQQGNVRKAWQPIHKAMAKGDAKALKKAVLQVTPKDHTYRRKWIEDFKVYKMGGIIYEINGNVKNGLNLRSKAQYGLATKYLKKKNKTTEKPVDNNQKDEPKVLDIRNTAGYKIKQAAENPWVKYPVEVASYLLTGATAKGMQVGAKVTKKTINKIDDILGKPRQEYLSRNVSDKTISYSANSKNSIGNTYKATSKDLNRAKKEIQNKPTINDLVEARSTVGNVPQHTTISYNPSPQSSVSTINYFDVKNTRLPNIERFGRKQMDAKTSRELDKVYRKAVGNKEPKSGFGRIPQQTTIEYIPKGESVTAYDASAEFHKRISDMLYNNLVKKYGKKGVDKAMKSEHISKYEYGGRIKAKNGKFLKYKNGIFTDPETGEEYEVEPEVFKMYGNTKESGVIPTADYTKGTFNTRPQYYAEKRLPIAGSQSIAEKAGLAKSGWSYSDSPTFDYVPNINISVPTNYAKAVGDNSKKSTSSTARGRETKIASSVSSRGTAKVESPKPTTAINPMEARYASRVQKGQAQEVTPKPVVEYNEAADKNPDKNRYTKATGFKNGNTSASSGNNQKEKDDKKDKDGRWIGQYKPVRTEDWIGLGSNLIGSVASYFMTKNAINKMPNPVKPVMAQAAKLKTRYNIEPQLSNVSEAEQMNRALVRRNTQSSNTSLAREQRLMNEARGSRNTLYGQKENIETQLINQDKLNRQTVYQKNVDTYNNYLNRIYLDKQHKAEARISNINNFIGGLTGSVNNMLNTIESRRTTNNTLRAIAAANPNVDARLIGGFDYYEGIGPDGKRKALYDKYQRFVRYI